MKASELIKELEKQIEKHGDLEVRIPWSRTGVDDDDFLRCVKYLKEKNQEIADRFILG